MPSGTVRLHRTLRAIPERVYKAFLDADAMAELLRGELAHVNLIPMNAVAHTPWTGTPIERFEDAALLAGAGRFMDDLGVPPGTLHAAFVRSPHAHARLRSIDTAAALAVPCVRAVLTVDHDPEGRAPAC